MSSQLSCVPKVQLLLSIVRSVPYMVAKALIVFLLARDGQS